AHRGRRQRRGDEQHDEQHSSHTSPLSRLVPPVRDKNATPKRVRHSNSSLWTLPAAARMSHISKQSVKCYKMAAATTWKALAPHSRSRRRLGLPGPSVRPAPQLAAANEPPG